MPAPFMHVCNTLLLLLADGSAVNVGMRSTEVKVVVVKKMTHGSFSAAFLRHIIF